MTTIPPEKLEAYKRGARAREARRRQEAERRREAARSVAKEAAHLLKNEFGAERVILFGSLVHGAWFHPDSDIDLVITGIAPDAFWRAWAALDQVSEGFEINLVALGDATENLRHEIEMRGQEL